MILNGLNVPAGGFRNHGKEDGFVEVLSPCHDGMITLVRWPCIGVEARDLVDWFVKIAGGFCSMRVVSFGRTMIGVIACRNMNDPKIFGFLQVVFLLLISGLRIPGWCLTNGLKTIVI